MSETFAHQPSGPDDRSFAHPEALSALRRWRLGFAFIGVVGAAAAIGGAFVDRTQFYLAYLTAVNFWLAIAVGSMALVMLHSIVGGAWGQILAGPLHSARRTLPLAFLFFVPLYFGIQLIYPWAAPGALSDPLIAHKAPYLNIPFFTGRAIFYFVVWTIFSTIVGFRPHIETTGWKRAACGIGLLLYGLTATFAAIDWLMSLEPHWYSTMFGLIFAIGQMLSAFAFSIAVVAIFASRRASGDCIQPVYMRDLGNLMLAFTMLWAYTSFCQYLLIYAGNLPEEVTWHLRRLDHGWQWLALALLLFQFALPFLLLLSRDVKDNGARLAKVAILVLVMRFFDLLWVIVPSTDGPQLNALWISVAAFAGIGGFWLLLCFHDLERWPAPPAVAFAHPEAGHGH